MLIYIKNYILIISLSLFPGWASLIESRLRGKYIVELTRSHQSTALPLVDGLMKHPRNLRQAGLKWTPTTFIRKEQQTNYTKQQQGAVTHEIQQQANNEKQITTKDIAT